MNKKPLRNTIAGLLAIGFIVCIVGIVLFKPAFGRPNTTTRETESQPQFYLADFRQLQGTPFLLAEITLAHESRSEFGISRWFSFNISEIASVHNLVFLNTETLESHVLFPTNEQGIMDMTQFPENLVSIYGQPGWTLDENARTEWLVYEIIVSDSNGDGVLNRDDPLLITISDASGYGYTELLDQIDVIYGMDMVEYGKLVITYLQKGKKLVSMIDMERKTLLETKELVNLGEDVR